MTEAWTGVIASDEVPPGAIVPVELDGTDAVLFRTTSGTVAAVARACPHLDADLVDGAIAGEELVCLAHGWSIHPDGRACKRNEFGREDPKGATRAWQVADRSGMICVRTD